jgi:putative endonuclease
MFYVYVLRSTRDDCLYTGCTKDLRNRFAFHNAGKVPSTKERRPFELIYYEACLDEGDAFRREKYLKTSYGKRYLKHRCKNYFTGQGGVTCSLRRRIRLQD